MTYRFSAFVTKEDQWYAARCPEWSVTSQGRDAETARGTFSEPIGLYMETWGVPEGNMREPESFWTFRSTPS